jgi:hypothetical protein
MPPTCRRPPRPAPVRRAAPFFIGAAAIVAGIAILSTAHGLLADAERVQAEQVSGGAPPAQVPALVPVEGSPAS